MAVVFLLALNFAISWLNAWGCGKTWTETRHAGSVPHFMNWMGAVMSACGFTWCYLLVFGFIAAQVPITNEETGLSAPLLTMEQVSMFFDLGYLVIILPVIGSGLAITVHSWGVFYRRRSLGDGLVAGWNTLAQVNNLYGAVQHVPLALDNVTGFFGSKSSGDRDAKGLVGLLAVAAVLAGIVTTATIISYVSKSTALTRRMRAEEAAEQPGV